MPLEQFKTQVLLLHSEQRTLDLLCTGFNDRYSVHCATSGIDALNTLGQTPIHVIICAQDLPGMSGLDALREARKRSPEMIGILLAGTDSSDGLEALVGEQEVFKIIRGEVKPGDLQSLVDAATKRVRMMAIAESANDTTANVDVFSGERDVPTGEHIVMETAANGSAIISDGTGTLPALKPERIQVTPNLRGRDIDVLVLSKDEEFLATIKESSLGLHDVYHAHTPTQAEEIVRKHKVGVLVTDAAMVGSNIEALTQRLRITVPRLVAIVAGRRDDGELLMDLINRGQVYRFLLKPVSPGRVRLAIEASVKHHLDAADSAFKGKPRTASSPVVKPALTPAPARKPAPAKTPDVPGKSKKAFTSPPARNTQTPKTPKSAPMRAPVREASLSGPVDLDDAFDEGADFGETMTDIAASVGKSISGASSSISSGAKSVVESSGKAMSGVTELLKNPKILAGAAGVAVVAISAVWMLSGDSDEVLDAISQQPLAAVTTPVVEDVDDSVPLEAAIPVEDTPPLSGDLLQQARDAQEAGNIVSPAATNAMEFYIAALAANPADEVIAAELDTLTQEAFGIAENALLANDLTEAARALGVIGTADPESPRLKFLNVQLGQLQLRDLLVQARIATSEARFEDAGQLLMQAEPLAGTNSSELDALTGELATARNEQQAQVENDRQVEAERQAAADAAASRAETERLAEADRVVAEAAAAKQAEADRVAAEAAAAKQVEADRVAAEAAAARQVEADRVAAEAAAAKQVEADRVAAEAAAAKQVEADRVAAEAAAAEQAEADRVAAEAAAAEQAEADRVAAEATIAKQAEADRVAAELAAAKPTPVAISAVKRIHYVSPKYPRAAQRRDISGWVDLSFTVTTAGDVADVEIIASEPETIFNATATRAVEQWRFEPATVDGQPIEKRIVMRMSFNLE